MERVLTQRVLNRTLLRRQFLLERTALPALDVVRHLVAVQAQEPDSPYVQLWGRIEGFAHDDLTRLLADREAVRSSILRGTQHLAAAGDYLWLRPLVAPRIAQAMRAGFGRQIAGIDVDELAAHARELLADGVLTRPQLGRLLAERYPGREALPLAWSVQGLLPLVHPSPEGTWRRRGATPYALAEAHLGATLDAVPDPRRLVLRYLAAFGPATVADVTAWSGVTRLKPVLEAMRPELRTFRGEAGRELFDLPDAPLADGGEPAPVRFLADFDNLVLGHADRTRVIGDEARARVIDGSAVLPVFLVDGFVAGSWAHRAGTLTVTPFQPLRRDRAAVLAEARNLAPFLGPGTEVVLAA